MIFQEISSMKKFGILCEIAIVSAVLFISACGDGNSGEPDSDGDELSYSDGDSLESFDDPADGDSSGVDGDYDGLDVVDGDNDAVESGDDVQPGDSDDGHEESDGDEDDNGNEIGDGEADITLSCDGITVDGTGAYADGSVVTVTDGGEYRISGILCDGQLRVDTADTTIVRLIFAGVDITCSNSAPLYVVQSEDVEIILESDTENFLTDGSSYVFENSEDTEPNAALFSKADLKIKGSGSLKVNGNYNDGIASKDSLTIKDGTYIISARDDGIRGKDDVTIEGGFFTITAVGDGISSDNEEDAERGYISISDGTFDIIAGGDGIAAQTDVIISGGDFSINAGGGSNMTVSDTESAKGIKGNAGIAINGGVFTIDSADDCIHSNGDITIMGGTFSLSTPSGSGGGDQSQGGQDGIHSDTNLQIDGGDITITKSYEGLEALYIIINDGTIHVNSSDDGFNCAGGDGSGGWNPGGPGGPGGGSSGDYLLDINGGYIWMNANGDGLDSNGNIDISGGVIIVNGPTSDGNGAIDHGDGPANYIKISGGLLVAAGSSGMAEAPGTTSTQNSVLVYLSASQQAEKLFVIKNSAGEELVVFAPAKSYRSVVFSSPDFSNGQYSIYLGGSSSGNETDGLYEGGVYTPGTQYTTFSVSSVTTKVGQGGGHP